MDLNPFEFFGLPPQFTLEEADLRARYFDVCRKFAYEDDAIIRKAHENFSLLKNPLTRLKALYKVKGVFQEPTEKNVDLDRMTSNVPTEICQLSERLFDMSPSEIPSFLDQLKKLKKEIEDVLQIESLAEHWGQVREKETQLSYILRLIDSAYRLMRHEDEETEGL